METEYLILVVFSMALVTYLPRVTPLWLLSSRDLPHWLTSWLSYVPVAVISALLAPVLLLDGREIAVNLQNPYILASFPTFLVAVKSRSLFGSVVAGMVSLVFISRLL